MEPFILFLRAIISMTGALLLLLHQLDVNNAREELNRVQLELEQQILFAPGPGDSSDRHLIHQRRCEELKKEMDVIIESLGFHPFDSLKPF